jgi:hypothetical protein
MFADMFLVDHGTNSFFRERFNLSDLMRCPKSIEEEQKRDTGLERRRMSDESKILRFLHRRRAKQREPGRTCGHDIAVITKNR